MKYAILLTGLLTLSCSGSLIDEELVSETLVGKGYRWEIHHEDTLISQELYFVNDSLFTTVFEHQGLKYSHLGAWSLIKNDKGTYFLNVTDIASTPSLKIEKWDGKQINLSWKGFTYEATPLPMESSDLAIDLQGSWIAHADSMMSPLKEYEETGQFLTNPRFTFRADSFDIYTKDFKHAGRLTVVDGTTQQLVLAWSPTLVRNEVIVVEKHGHKNLVLRLKDEMGTWNRYELERVNE